MKAYININAGKLWSEVVKARIFSKSLVNTFKYILNKTSMGQNTFRAIFISSSTHFQDKRGLNSGVTRRGKIPTFQAGPPVPPSSHSKDVGGV